MSTGENIRRLREEHHLSQAELGKIAGVSDKAVSTWESDKKMPRMGAVQKLADYFGLQKSNIIEDDGLDLVVQKKDEITFDNFTYALHNESKELTQENKQKLLEMARLFKMAQDNQKE